MLILRQFLQPDAETGSGQRAEMTAYLTPAFSGLLHDLLIEYLPTDSPASGHKVLEKAREEQRRKHADDAKAKLQDMQLKGELDWRQVLDSVRAIEESTNTEFAKFAVDKFNCSLEPVVRLPDGSIIRVLEPIATEELDRRLLGLRGLPDRFDLQSTLRPEQYYTLFCLMFPQMAEDSLYSMMCDNEVWAAQVALYELFQDLGGALDECAKALDLQTHLARRWAAESEQLLQQGLNPASHFTMDFNRFDPAARIACDKVMAVLQKKQAGSCRYISNTFAHVEFSLLDQFCLLAKRGLRHWDEMGSEEAYLPHQLLSSRALLDQCELIKKDFEVLCNARDSVALDRRSRVLGAIGSVQEWAQEASAASEVAQRSVAIA